MKICYKDINFRSASLELIERVNRIVAEYDAQGYELTLRQVYYQLVARGYIENNERSYKNLGNLINDGRLAGLIDWYAIVDRTRNLRSNSHWETPESVINSAKYSYMLDRWKNQPNYVEVWVEKDALEPKVITDLIQNEVTALMDEDLHDEIEQTEERDKRNIGLICQRYHEVVDFLHRG